LPTPQAGIPQDDVNRLVGDARKQARETAVRELSDKLGMSPEDAEKRLKEIADAENQKLGEAERKLKEAESKESKASDISRASESVIVDVLKRDALWRLGMTPEQADAAKDLVKIEGSLTADDAVEKVTAAAKQVQATFPQLFGTPAATDDGGNGDGGQPPPAGTPFPPRAVDSTPRGGPPREPARPSANKDKSRNRLRDLGLMKPASSSQ